MVKALRITKMEKKITKSIGTKINDMVKELSIIEMAT